MAPTNARLPGDETPARLPRSWYAASAGAAPCAPPLDGPAEADVCVIGGGFAGLGAALELARAGRTVRLVEMGPIGWGASGRNGGQVHPGWQQDMGWFEARFGPDGTRAYWAAALEARAHLDTLIALDADACDFRAGLIHADVRARDVAATHAHVRHMREVYGHTALSVLSRDELRARLASPAYHGGAYDALGGHLHPLKLAHAMARAAIGAGARLHTMTRASAVVPQGAGWRVETPHGSVTARAVLDATGAYARALVPGTAPRVLPINNFIATTEPLGAERAQSLIADGAAVSDSRFVVYYFRMTPDHRLLFGGGESYGRSFPRDIAAFVRRHMRRVFAQVADVPISHAWGGTLAISPHRLPFVHNPAPGLYALNGFSGVGVALAPWAGRAVARAMAGDDDPGYALLARLPTPRFPGGTALRWPTQALAMKAMALRDLL